MREYSAVTKSFDFSKEARSNACIFEANFLLILQILGNFSAFYSSVKQIWTQTNQALIKFNHSVNSFLVHPSEPFSKEQID